MMDNAASSAAQAMTGNVTNAEFLGAVFGAVKADERMWVTMFSTPPNSARGEWRGGDAKTSEDVPDADRVNAYFSVAALRVIDGIVNRDKTHFGRLCSVVTDDSPVDDGASWVLETSEGNFQNGYILANDITDCGVAERLHKELARAKAVKADTSGNNPVRYVRLPVGTNTKCDPPFANQLRVWQPEVVFALEDVCERLGLDIDYITNGQQQAESPRDHNLERERDTHRVSDGELIRQITTTENYHDPLLKLTARYRSRGIKQSDIVETVRGIMESNGDRSERWQSRYNDIPRVVAGAFDKFKMDEAVAADWPELADPFAKYPVPPFPVDALPSSFAQLCRELSAQSGFDVGGYAFACLITASSLPDHRKRMRAGPLSVPSFLWGGLVANSGGGKSPTLNAVVRPVRRINDTLVKASQKDLAQWLEEQKSATTAEERKNLPPKPVWRQLTANDTTVEALGHLMADNPRGMILVVDELTGFIGRMDAYNAAGSGKDRAVYLSAWDGGGVTINRASKMPLVVDNFSVGIICGIQPEKLGELFKKSGGGSDGLYQRFLMYAMQPAGNVDYAARLGMYTEVNSDELFKTLFLWTEQGLISGATLCDEALPLMQAYHQSMRTIAQRTAGQRLAEHLDKYPGFLARTAYALHCMECAGTGEIQPIVSLETFNRARHIMQVMYHHSVAVYEVLDAQSGDLARLTKAACEAILSQGWTEIKRGDLTRYATDWRDADDRQAESALDYLIELGWIKDITPAVAPGKRGRRSSGVFQINKLAHQVFASHTERIKMERAARFSAIKTIAGGRNAAE